MRLKRTRSVTLIVVLAFAGLYAVFAVLAASPVQATGTKQPGIEVLTFDNDHVATPMLDRRGELIGSAMHRGGLRCDEGMCSQQTEVQLISASVPVTIAYSFESLQAAYPEEERIVVAGTGVLSTSAQTTQFRFEATFWDNGDGTMSTRYDATLSEASFTIPRTSGSIEIYCYPIQGSGGDFDELLCE